MFSESAAKIPNGQWKSDKLTGERNDGIHVDRLHSLAVGRDQGERVTFERNLRWTDRSVGIDQSETITAAGSYGEDLQGCVRHETGVRILWHRKYDLSALLLFIAADRRDSWKNPTRKLRLGASVEIEMQIAIAGITFSDIPATTVQKKIRNRTTLIRVRKCIK